MSILNMGVLTPNIDKTLLEQVAERYQEIGVDDYGTMRSWRWHNGSYIGSFVVDRFFFTMKDRLEFRLFWPNQIFDSVDRQFKGRTFIYIYENGMWSGAPDCKFHPNQRPELVEWIKDCRPLFIDTYQYDSSTAGDTNYLYINEIPSESPWLFMNYGEEEAYNHFVKCTKIHIKNETPFSPSQINKLMDVLDSECSRLSIDGFVYKDESFEDLHCKTLNLCCSKDSYKALVKNKDLFKNSGVKQVNIYTGDINNPVHSFLL